MASCQQIVTSLSFFLVYGQSAAIRKPDSGRMIYKTYIFINNDLLFYKNWKQKISNTALILLLWVKVLFLEKNDILQKKFWNQQN